MEILQTEALCANETGYNRYARASQETRSASFPTRAANVRIRNYYGEFCPILARRSVPGSCRRVLGCSFSDNEDSLERMLMALPSMATLLPSAFANCKKIVCSLLADRQN